MLPQIMRDVKGNSREPFQKTTATPCRLPTDKLRSKRFAKAEIAEGRRGKTPSGPDLRARLTNPVTICASRKQLASYQRSEAAHLQ